MLTPPWRHARAQRSWTGISGSALVARLNSAHSTKASSTPRPGTRQEELGVAEVCFRASEDTLTALDSWSVDPGSTIMLNERHGGRTKSCIYSKEADSGWTEQQEGDVEVELVLVREGVVHQAPSV